MSVTDTAVLLEGLREELSQGDIIEFCPVGSVAELRAARIFNGEEDKPDAKALVYRHPVPQDVKRQPTPALFKKPNDGPEMVMFEARLKRCVVISNDCVALAKASNKAITFEVTRKTRESPWHVAPLDPWPPDSQTVNLGAGVTRPRGDLIAEGRFHSLLEIPEVRTKDGQVLLPRSVLDLRYLTPLKPQLFTSASRIASMSDMGIAVLSAKVFTYFSGLSVPAALKCPACSVTFRLDDLLRKQKPAKAEDVALPGSGTAA